MMIERKRDIDKCLEKGEWTWSEKEKARKEPKERKTEKDAVKLRSCLLVFLEQEKKLSVESVKTSFQEKLKFFFFQNHPEERSRFFLFLVVVYSFWRRDFKKFAPLKKVFPFFRKLNAMTVFKIWKPFRTIFWHR